MRFHEGKKIEDMKLVVKMSNVDHLPNELKKNAQNVMKHHCIVCTIKIYSRNNREGEYN